MARMKHQYVRSEIRTHASIWKPEPQSLGSKNLSLLPQAAGRSWHTWEERSRNRHSNAQRVRAWLLPEYLRWNESSELGLRSVGGSKASWPEARGTALRRTELRPRAAPAPPGGHWEIADSKCGGVLGSLPDQFLLPTSSAPTKDEL